MGALSDELGKTNHGTAQFWTISRPRVYTTDVVGG